MEQTLHRVATKEGEEIKGKTKQKMARRHNKEGGNHLLQESKEQRTMEGIDGGLLPAVDWQSLGEKYKMKEPFMTRLKVSNLRTISYTLK